MKLLLAAVGLQALFTHMTRRDQDRFVTRSLLVALACLVLVGCSSSEEIPDSSLRASGSTLPDDGHWNSFETCLDLYEWNGFRLERICTQTGCYFAEVPHREFGCRKWIDD